MDFPDIDTSSAIAAKESFYRVADHLFNQLLIQVNDSYYRIIDIEFYPHNDAYTHGHPQELLKGKWYFHGSGIDLTIGDGTHHSGILIRSAAKLSDP